VKTPIEHSPTHATETPVPAGVWRVDPQRSEIGFAVKEMWGLRIVRGVFGEFEGSLTVRAGRITGDLTIQADSVETGNKRRDKHLRSPAFFNVERQPRILFTTTALTARDGAMAVIGELAIGASRARLEIPVNVEQIDDRALRIEGKTTVSRHSVGVAWNVLGMIRGHAVLHAQLTLTRDG
jgi:polyisoprenoid-binding protein YceI